MNFGPGPLRTTVNNSTGVNGSGDYVPVVNNGTIAGVGATGYCVWLSWTFRGTDAPLPLCNAVEDFIGEGELPWGNIRSWNDTTIVFVTMEGAGTKDIIIGARGSLSASAAADISGAALLPRAWRFKYAAPHVWSITPSAGGSTGGGDLVTIIGENFGPRPRNTSDPSQRLIEGGTNFAVSLGLPLAAAPSLPTYAVKLQVGASCMSDSYDGYGGRSYGIAFIVASCTESALVSHNHSVLQFILPPGVGANISVIITVMDSYATMPLYTSNPLTYGYVAPMVQSFAPNPVQLFGQSVVVGIAGTNFGDAASVTSWTPAQQLIRITVGGTVCTNAQRLVQPPFGTILSCNLGANTSVGVRAVSVTVAGQTVLTSVNATPAFSPLQVVCGAGYFGRIGEQCLPCPSSGAVCAGFNDSISLADVIPGLLANPADVKNTYPVALPDYYSLSRSCIQTFDGAGNAAENCSIVNATSACPPQVAAIYPGRDTCIVGCRPGACLGDNACAPGYMSVAPLYRCATCVPGYYSRYGSCVACPAAAPALVFGLLLLVLLITAVAYILHRKQIMIGYIPLAVDCFQVVTARPRHLRLLTCLL
jgi:hypothetical protein